VVGASCQEWLSAALLLGGWGQGAIAAAHRWWKHEGADDKGGMHEAAWGKYGPGEEEKRLRGSQTRDLSKIYLSLYLGSVSGAVN
jgi:hypothetical protein